MPYLCYVMWADALPNLLIALREGLEAGLVVTILLAAVRKLGGRSAFPVWIGVLGALSLSASFAAVLSYSTTVLDSNTQQLVAGILSIVSVVLVTWMVFWMRTAARGLSGELTRKVGDTALIGAGALALTAFFAIAREGLETTLFIWAAVKASGSTAAPLAGAGIGLAIAGVLCWLMYRGALRLNLGVFFSRTAILLLVVAAGVLAYGIGDLQDAGVLPGGTWLLFDFSGTPAGESWWMALITGITALRPRMSVLQAAAWLAYLGISLPLYLRRPRTAATSAPKAAAPKAAAPKTVDAGAAAPVRTGRGERLLHRAERRIWLAATVIIAVPALVAVAVVALLPAGPAGSTTVSVTAQACGDGWSGGAAGPRTFAVSNRLSHPVEVRLTDAGGSIVGEIETLGPGTTASMSATLSAGRYGFVCLSAASTSMRTIAATITGSGGRGSTVAISPVTVADLTAPNAAYQVYARARLDDVTAAATAMDVDLASGDVAKAKIDWLLTQQAWERVGASYNSFGVRGVAADGLPSAFSGGAADPAFTGLHRIECGLWHGEDPVALRGVVADLQATLVGIRAHLADADLAGDPTTLAVRAHEILEDAQRDHLSGADDQGAGAGYAMTDADLDATGSVLDLLAPLIDQRAPGLVASAHARLADVRTALAAARGSDGWRSPAATPPAQRQRINATVGAALETLADIPGLLEVPRI